ncbi:DUF3710 domain-containing protein [Arthrobacter sp. TMN-37]
MVFGRLKKKKQDDGRAEPSGAEAAGESGGPEAGEAAPAEATAEAQRRELGPFDSAEKDSTEGYIDLGALKIGAAEGLQLRLEVEERTKRVIAVTLDLGGSTLQLQAFAAPRSEGVWDEIRQQIGLSVGSQGGTVQEREGTFGTELIAQLPAPLPDGTAGVRVARFVGVDGPRWFLRGVFGGPAALNGEAAAPVERLFRNVVVVRGDHPLPPRELLPLRLPKDASPTPNPAAPGRPGLTAPQRGPEITEIG